MYYPPLIELTVPIMQYVALLPSLLVCCSLLPVIDFTSHAPEERERESDTPKDKLCT